MSDLLDLKSHDGNKSLPNATAVLVLGIISIATCWIYGLPGIVCGIIAIALHQKDKKLYEENPQAYEHSYKNLKAGFICGIIGLSLSALFLVYIILMITLFGTLMSNVSRY